MYLSACTVCLYVNVLRFLCVCSHVLHIHVSVDVLIYLYIDARMLHMCVLVCINVCLAGRGSIYTQWNTT